MYNHSNAAVAQRRDDLIRMERTLSAEARGILWGMIVECLDLDPSKRPTSEMLIEALGTQLNNIILMHVVHVILNFSRKINIILADTNCQTW